jgi:hypothetical protein
VVTFSCVIAMALEQVATRIDAIAEALGQAASGRHAPGPYLHRLIASRRRRDRVGMDRLAPCFHGSA